MVRSLLGRPLVASALAVAALASAPAVSAQSVSSASSASSLASSSASSALGCILVNKQTQNTNGSNITPVAQFTFTMDGVSTATNDANGVARFDNVTPGQHTVVETVPATWQQVSVFPAAGTVVVAAGSSCAQVSFVNRQVVAQSATFQVQKTDGRTTAAAGDVLEYVITVTNTSSTTASNVSVVDVLPPNLTFLSASDNASVSGQTVTWNLSNVAPGVRTLTLRARIVVGTPNGTQLRNTVQVNGQATAEDFTTVSGSSGDEDLTITITDSPDPVEPGEELDYEIEVCNEDDADIEDLTVLQILPDDVEVIDEDGGDVEDDETITWDDIDIDEDDCVTFDVTVEVDDSYEDGDELETVVLAGGESDEETTDVEEDDDDDDDDADGDLDIRKEASQNEVFPGGVVEYTLTIDNDTGEDLDDVVVRDVISGGGFSIVDDGGADQRSGGTLRWEIGSLDDGETKVIRYRVSVDAGAFPGQLIRNDVTVEADGFDDQASVTVAVIGQLPQTGFAAGAGAQAGVLISLGLTGMGLGAAVARRKLGL